MGRRAAPGAVALTVLSVGLMLVLVMFAARAGPQRIVHGTLVDPHGHADVPLQSPQLRTLGKHHGQGVFHRLATLTWLGRVIRVLIVVLLAWLAYRLLRVLAEVVRARERPPPRPAAVDFDVLDDPDDLVDQMRKDAAGQRALLQGGTPRNAIVACWDRFEEQAGRVGLARRPWETSSEFTLRLLDVVSADHGAVAQLERLYHEARFSEHPIDEGKRASATEALDAVHASLHVRATAR